MYLSHGRTEARHAGLALCGLALATAAMLILHIVQRVLDPLQQPVSFYVHGDHGWLFTFGVGCFGVAAILLALAVSDNRRERLTSVSLIVFGAGMLVAAVVPSDRWFPWEAQPTTSGVVHAAAAVFSPPGLLVPVLRWTRRARGRVRRFSLLFVIAFIAGLVGSALSLGIGFIHDGPPPLIGLTERVLALGSLSWLSAVALERR